MPLRSLYLLLLNMVAAFPLLGRQTDPVIKPGQEYPFLQNTIPAAMPANVAERSGSSTSRINASECRNTTFQLRIPVPAGQQIRLASVRPLPDGRYLAAGTVTLAGSISEAFLMAIDDEGSVQVQKRFRVNGKPVVLDEAQVSIFGDVFITGRFTDGTMGAFIAGLSSDLTFAWTKIMDLPEAPVKTTLSLNAGIAPFVAVQLSGAIHYAQYQPNGALGYRHQLTHASMTKLVYFGNAGFTPGIVVQGMFGGVEGVQFFEIDQNTGNIVGSAISAHSPASTQVLATTWFSGRLNLIYATNDGAWETGRMRLAEVDNTESIQKYSVPFTPDLTVSAAMDNAGDALGYFVPATRELYFIKQLADLYIQPEFSKSYAVPDGGSLAGIARSPDGGFLFGLTGEQSNQLIFIKTDSSGALPACGFQTHTISYVLSNMIANTAVAATSSTVLNGEAPTICTETITSYTPAITCQAKSCPMPPNVDECLTSYYKILRSGSYIDYASQYHLLRNNQQLLNTRRTDRILGAGNIITNGLKLLDERGNLVKSVEFFASWEPSPTLTTFPVDDHRVMVYVRTASSGTVTLLLMDDNLQQIWTKSFQVDSDFYSGGLIISDIHMDVDGNFFVLGTRTGFNTTTPAVFVIKLDANGNELWNRSYELFSAPLGLASVTTTATSIIIVVESQRNVSLQMDRISGQMLNAWSFDLRTDGSLYRRMLKYDNDRIYYAGSNHGGNFVMGILDTTGRPQKLRVINNSSIMRSADVRDGSFYATFNYYRDGAQREVLLKADPDLVPEFMHEYTFDRDRISVGMGISSGGYIYTAGNRPRDFSSAYFDPVLIKFTQDGELGNSCPYTPAALPIVDLPAQPVNVPYNIFFRQYPAASGSFRILPGQSQLNVSEILCKSISECNSIELSDPGPICQLNTDISIPYTRNINCAMRPVWEYNADSALLKQTTDAEGVFQFLKTGNVRLVAFYDPGCGEIFSDTIVINVQQHIASLELGADTTICPGDSLVLDAGPGFSQYTWQDGSGETGFTVKTDGKYYVEVQNACGNNWSDTIVVALDVVPALHAGNDVTICAGDTITLHAGNGFTTYSWQPAIYTIGQGEEVRVVVPHDTIAVVNAYTALGCMNTDTVQLIAIYPRPVHLGADTSFCASDSITLQAGSGYQHYTWNNGSTEPAITVKQAGTWWVAALDVNGCYARDTMQVVRTFPAPVVDLGIDRALCAGSVLMLDGGTQAAWEWQDGSQTRQYAVTDTGRYWVNVVDWNGCKGGDSVYISTLLQSPSAFLKAVDTVCRYGKLVIVPVNEYAKYQWSTGGTGSSITVDKPGMYTLTVTDQAGCTGSDAITVVQKDCLSGVFVPNAFTPNGDRHNDVFRALVSGPIVRFSLTVYNRYGERIFYTADPDRAWDGTWGGKPCDHGNYVWQCSYQLEGQEPVFLKGFVILIR